jgi:hypothetical protein
MKSSKFLGRYVCRLVMALSVSFLLMEASSAANITKLFLTSSRSPFLRRDCLVRSHRRKRFRHFQEDGPHMGAEPQ